jgi:hypothetical protein
MRRQIYHATDPLGGLIRAFTLGLEPPGDPLAIERVQRIVSRIEYKPGWTIEAERPQGRGSGQESDVVFTFRLPTFDRDTRKPVMLKFNFRYSNVYTEQGVVDTVMQCILALEDHEARELFVYDGERLYDPHK